MAGRSCPWFGHTQTHTHHLPSLGVKAVLLHPWGKVASPSRAVHSSQALGLLRPSCPPGRLNRDGLVQPRLQGRLCQPITEPFISALLGNCNGYATERANVITCNQINQCKSQTTAVRQRTAKPPTTVRQRPALFPISE